MKRVLLSFVAVLWLASAVFADQPANSSLLPGQSGTPQAQGQPNPNRTVGEAENTNKPWGFTGGVDFQTKYIFRGFTTTKSGLILQPYGQFSYTVFNQKVNGDEMTISPYIGTWNNVTSHPFQIKPGNQSGNLRWWSEVDADGGVTATWRNFTLGVNFIYYSYPNGSIADDFEAGITLGYDDSGYWANNKVFAAVNPHVAYYHEISNLAGPEGGYLELGIEPTLKPINIGKIPVTLSAPLTLGLTTDKYYTDSHGSTTTFGYFEAGVKASIPLDFLSNTTHGSWTLVGEVDYYHLNADNLRSLDDGKSDDVTARLGLTFKF